VPRKTSAPKQGPDQQGRPGATPHTLPLQPATAPRRRVDRTWYCRKPCCATAAHGRRARGRVSLATTSCLGHSDQLQQQSVSTLHASARTASNNTPLVRTRRGGAAAARTAVKHEKSAAVHKGTHQFSTGRKERREAAPHREGLSRTCETSGSRASVAARTVNTTPQVASVRKTCSQSATGEIAAQVCAGVNGGNGFGALGEDEEGAATDTVSVTSLR